MLPNKGKKTLHLFYENRFQSVMETDKILLNSSSLLMATNSNNFEVHLSIRVEY